MNKFLAVFCMAAASMAAPEAEADPYLLYGGYGGYGHLGYGAYGYGGYGHLGYGLYGGYASHSPSAGVHINGLAPAAVPAIAGGYAGAGRYVANSAGVVHVAKREATAEAEAEAEADPYLLYGGYNGLYGYNGLGYAGYHGLGYAGYAGLGLGYNYGLGYGHYAGYAAAPVVAAAAPVVAKAAPVVAAAAPAVVHAAPVVAAGYASHSPSASVHIAGLAAAAVPAVAGGYAGAGRYCANSAGVLHCA